MKISNWSRNRIGQLAFLGLALAASIGRAQNVPAPQAPSVAPVPEGCSWQVKVTVLNREDTAADAPVLKEFRGERVAGLRHETQDWSNGTVERWMTPYFLLEKFPQNSNVALTRITGTPADVEKKFGQIAEAKWVSQDNYKRMEMVGKQTCHYYEMQQKIALFLDNEDLELIKQGKMQKPKDIEISKKAWINAETKLPVAIENRGSRFEYTFTPGVVQSLTLPQEFQAAIPTEASPPN